MQTQCRGSFMRIEICIAKEKMTKCQTVLWMR